jgi:proteasome lid subunit RPN8/RPN11
MQTGISMSDSPPTTDDTTANERLVSRLQNELLTDSHLESIADWVEQAYPEEGCGLIVRGDAGVEVRRCENLANQYHQLDPEQYPRTAEQFYVIDPMEFVRAERSGESIEIVFHSHADVGDYFSDEDVDAATLPSDDGEPLEEAHPGVLWLVVSVRDGTADHATLFEFNEAGAESVDTAFREAALIDRRDDTWRIQPADQKTSE